MLSYLFVFDDGRSFRTVFEIDRERERGQEEGREGGEGPSNMSYDKCDVCLIHFMMEKVS